MHDFNVILLALTSIYLVCGIFIGLSMKMLPPKFGGLLLLLCGALPHCVCLILAIQAGHTVSACILAIFSVFWIYLGSGYLFLKPDPNDTGLLSGLDRGLLFLEPPMAVMIFVFQQDYWAKSTVLAWLLGSLGVTVIYLWLTKFVAALHTSSEYSKSNPPAIVRQLNKFVPVTVFLLSIHVIYAINDQLH
ncbi:MAG: hypothetical protein GYB33_12130 [Gammaproteobacteria bacterium]|uniref:hypothetical protein n=1 Tax=Pseudomaricurvus alcaniphilus TaxID=1166482 RepID=UPI0014095325|nr:hypothetical protein [Pseudomaricurvus alcaniphilus]MBR9911086.1 hypothetical protein [Gammaproteobacteria bacterium]NHN36410.1 hypothetical protein [Pseudomaricurvus alcaniphilus]